MRFCDLLIGTRLKHRDWTGYVWGLDPVLSVAIVRTETEPARRVTEKRCRWRATARRSNDRNPGDLTCTGPIRDRTAQVVGRGDG